jgi:hypothetical protein
MTKRQPAATHPRAAPDQLLSIAIATLASKLNSASIVKKKSPPHLEDAFMRKSLVVDGESGLPEGEGWVTNGRPGTKPNGL